MVNPNILLTNFCNQSCSFCFARQEMSSINKPKEISLENYRLIINRLGRGKTLQTVKLLGGEPLLHSNIEQIILYTFSHSKTLQLFTNGIFSKEKLALLQPYAQRLALVVNIATPGFEKNHLLRKSVLNNIRALGKRSKIVLSLTVGKNKTGIENIKLIPKKIIPYIHAIRLGIINPLKNNCLFEELPILGNNVFELVKKVRLILPSVKILFNCGFTRCMFTNNQLNYFKKQKIKIPGWGCLGKDGQIDITVDLRVIGCYLSSTEGGYSIKKGVGAVEKIIILNKYKNWLKKRPSVCLKCPYNVFMGGDCPGPCVG